MSTILESSLVERAKGGDIKAFEQLMKTTSSRIYNLGYRLLHNKEDAADVMQETYMTAYKNLSRFRGNSSFSTWLYRIATNFALMKMRKEKGKRIPTSQLKKTTTDSIYETEFPDWSDTPVDHLKNQELKEILDKEINALPPKYRSVFVLHDIEGLSISEVAEILSLSEAAVKTRSHRSRLYLREKLSEYFRGNREKKELIPA
jgi:RNA polymerase sigma-70 factor, ECF subfamily